MLKVLGPMLLAALAVGAPSASAAMQEYQKVKDIWQPAKTPPGGTPWKLLETTKEITRNQAGTIYSKPIFPASVRALNGKQVKVAGWMSPLDAKARQGRFLLLAYPPGCPFHFHAMPNQFVDVHAAVPVAVNERDPMVIQGTLQLTGMDESGIFYRLVNARKL